MSKCICAICGNDNPFTLPDQLLEAATSEKLIVFAGAGISTESRTVFPDTFAEVIADRAGIDDTAAADLSFPQIMDAFCERHSRSELVQEILKRFEYVNSYWFLREVATEFHASLSRIPFISVIVTTNWDNYFEEHCDALPIVVPEDYSFWDMPRRRVLKIHGSVANVGTIVATSADYTACDERLRSGLLGATLQHLLATNTVVFVGYSLRDPDFLSLYSALKEQLGVFMPRSYIVTLDDTEAFEGHPEATLIRTSGAHFVAELKRTLTEQGWMLNEEQVGVAHMCLERARAANRELFRAFPPKEHPAVIYSAAYQDGIVHACQRIVTRSKSGDYMTEGSVLHRLHSYDGIAERMIDEERWFDLAYVDGVLMGISSMLMSERDFRKMPLYYLIGSSKRLDTVEKFAKELPKAHKLHKKAYKSAVKTVSRLGEEMVVYHTPFI